MRFLTLSKILLILILPVLLFLLVLNFAGFDDLFYQDKFAEYEVDKNVPEADSLHEKVINFIKGKNDELPNQFNDREKQHLSDVRNVIKISTILFYVLIILFIVLLMMSALTLKVNNKVTGFVGNVLVFGGFLTIILAAILFLFINSDFSATFGSFHNLFFDKGTYAFDPAKELIVNLYPEELFMDIGIKLSKGVIITSVIITLIGGFLILKSKRIKRARHK